jgi:hypothetical protein
MLRAALVDCSVQMPGQALRLALTDLAWLVNQHLPKAERQALWKVLSDSRCRARLDEGGRQWLALHAAVGAEDGAEMARLGGELLKEPLGSDVVPYVLAAQMSGLLLTGKPDEAMRALQQHGNRIGAVASWQPVFRFLVGQATRVD